MLFVLTLLACSLFGGNDANPDRKNRGPTPKDGSAKWARPLKCDKGAPKSGNPKKHQPKYWAVFPDCHLPLLLDFDGKEPFEPTGFPFEPIPKGSAHQWCPPDKNGHQKYQMRVPIQLRGSLERRYIVGRLVNGKPDGTFTMIGAQQKAIVTGEFKAGEATGDWTWGHIDDQNICATAKGAMNKGVPTGPWTAAIVDGTNVRFKGHYTSSGWQGVQSTDMPGGVVEELPVKDGIAQR